MAKTFCWEHEIREADCPKCIAEGPFPTTIPVPLADLLAIRDALEGVRGVFLNRRMSDTRLDTALATIEGLLP